MTGQSRAIWVVARRDFLSVVATPTFLLFLLTPLFMVAMGLVGGVGASQLATTQQSSTRLVVVTAPDDARWLRAAAARFDGALPSGRAAQMNIREQAAPLTDAAVAAIFDEAGSDTLAVLHGPLTAPVVVERGSADSTGRYLALLAQEAGRMAASGQAQATGPTARMVTLPRTGTSVAAAQSLGIGAVFILFLLTLLLAGQAVGMLAEEKGNKVIEILAAAVPLEAVFLGKLLGLLGVAGLFIAFWMAMAVGGGALFSLFGDLGAATAAQPAAADIAEMITPAVGWGWFLALGLAYFVMAFLLLGAIFLSVGAQASTVREIQMLSLPITIFQVGMFALASAAANAPGTALATFAQWFPFSSPFAMAARGATDGALLVHGGALAWQALWVAAIIWLGARLFRSGVLGGRSWRWPVWRRKAGG